MGLEVAHELGDAQRLRLAELVGARVARGLGVAVGEVAVEIDAASAVLTHESIGIGVEALDKDFVGRDLTFVVVGGADDARICGIDNMGRGAARRRDAAHHGDHAVAINIARSILVNGSIAVVINRAQIGRPRITRLERHGARIRIRFGNCVDTHRFQQRLLFAIKRLQRSEHLLGGHHGLAVHAADDQQCGQLPLRVGSMERDGANRKSAARSSDALDARIGSMLVVAKQGASRGRVASGKCAWRKRTGIDRRRLDGGCCRRRNRWIIRARKRWRDGYENHAGKSEGAEIARLRGTEHGAKDSRRERGIDLSVRFPCRVLRLRSCTTRRANSPPGTAPP